MKKFSLILLFLLLLNLGAGCVRGDSDDIIGVPDETTDEVDLTEVLNNDTEEEVMKYEFPGTLPDEDIKNKQVTIDTDKGKIVIELYPDTAPLTVSNFVYLANAGYYDSLTFHRRVEGFVIQGGDPLGSGMGGPGYKFADELNDEYSYDKGIVAMANSGPDSNGSQFFIMLADYPLDKAYTIFGRVTEGLDVVDGIVVGDVMSSVSVDDK